MERESPLERRKRKSFEERTHTCSIHPCIIAPVSESRSHPESGGIRPLGVRAARGIFRGALVKADRRHDVRD